MDDAQVVLARIKKERQVDTLSYTVTNMSCDHCKMTITRALSGLPNVRDVDIDLGSQRVTVSGEQLNDQSLRSAIEDAGYDVRA